MLSDLFNKDSNFGKVVETYEGNTSEGSDAAEAAIETGLSYVPFVGPFLAQFSGKLNISENYNLVKQYGWSSWGASTSPEQTKATFAEVVHPWFISQIERVTPENMGKVFSEVHAALVINADFVRKLRKHHARAESTQQAYDWAAPEFDKMSAYFTDVVGELKKQGVTITQTNVSGSASSFNIDNLRDPGNQILDHDVLTANFNLPNWQINAEQVRNLNAEIDEETGQLTLENKTSSFGFGGLIMTALIGFAIKKSM